MEEKKTNFFCIPVFSFVPAKYKELVKNSAGKIFGVILVMFLLFGIISGINVALGVGEFADVVAESCPDFELSNGSFSIEAPFEMEQDGMYILIDDRISNVTEDDIKDLIRENFYSQIIVLGSDSFGMYNNGQIQAFDLDQVSDFSISKTSLINEIIPAFKPLIFGAVVLFYLIYVGFYYLAALIMSLFTMIICKIFKKDIESKERFRMTVLAKLPVFIVTFVIELVSPLSINIWIGALLVIAFTVAIVAMWKDDENQQYISSEDNEF